MRWLALLLVAGCYDPQFKEGLACSPEGECPPDQICDIDHVCRAKSVVDAAPAPMVTFAPHADYTAAANDARAAIGDLDHDGRPDIATNSNAGAQIFLQSATAPGAFARNPPVGTSFCNSVAIADLNGDMRGDLVVASGGLLLIYLQSATGGFGSPTMIAAPDLWQIAIADLDGDGQPDLVTSDGSSNEIGVVLQQTGMPGSFRSPMFYPSGGTTTVFVVIADLNGDGKLDVVASNVDSGTLSVFLQSSGGNLQSAVNYTVTAANWTLGVGDIDGDGKPDIAVGGRKAGVLYQDPQHPGTFGPLLPLPMGDGVLFPTVADLDGNGRADVVAGAAGNQVYIWLSDPRLPSHFASPLLLTVANGAQAPVVGDLDGDGKPDLVVPAPDSGKLSVLLQK